MCNLTAKEFLQQARDIDRQIHADMLEACRLRSIAEKATSTFTATNISGTPRRSNVEDAALELAELEGVITDEIHALVKAKQDIRTAIYRIERPEERAVLHLRYLCGKKWEEIAVELHYSCYHVTHRIHPRALSSVKHALECTY